MAAVATVRPTLVLDGVEVSLARGADGVLVVEIETPDVSGADANYDDTPRLRVWVNDALLHDASGECTPIEAAESRGCGK